MLVGGAVSACNFGEITLFWHPSSDDSLKHLALSVRTVYA